MLVLLVLMLRVLPVVVQIAERHRVAVVRAGLGRPRLYQAHPPALHRPGGFSLGWMFRLVRAGSGPRLVVPKVGLEPTRALRPNGS